MPSPQYRCIRLICAKEMRDDHCQRSPAAQVSGRRFGPGGHSQDVKAMATHLGVPETQVAHLVPAKLAEKTLPDYEVDDGTLTARHLAAVQADAAKRLPKGKVLSEASLFS